MLHTKATRVTPQRILFMNTLAFTICFAVWMLNGALIEFLTSSGLYHFTATEFGMLIAAPVLTGSVLRLPLGMLTDRFGGKPVYAGTMLVAAAGVFSVSLADSFWDFLLSALAFGVAGASFAVGVGFTSTWFPKEKQGTALGIFGVGNAGAAVTLLLAPKLLTLLTTNNPDGWRWLPVIYGCALLVMTWVFLQTTRNRVTQTNSVASLSQRLAPLKNAQVWRFGLYYFLVFGAFVGLSGWLVKYYVEVYEVSLATAGVLAAVFSLPSGVIRAGGGWLSDKLGARTVMYWVLGSCLAGALLLCMPLDIYAFTFIVSLVGVAMGVGKAAVYKHIPMYFPREVGTVGGIVGVLGGLGGFVTPIVFSSLLVVTSSAVSPEGLWTSAWIFLAALSAAALAFMHLAIRRIEFKRLQAPATAARSS